MDVNLNDCYLARFQDPPNKLISKDFNGTDSGNTLGVSIDHLTIPESQYPHQIVRIPA